MEAREFISAPILAAMTGAAPEASMPAPHRRCTVTFIRLRGHSANAPAENQQHQPGEQKAKSDQDTGQGGKHRSATVSEIRPGALAAGRRLARAWRVIRSGRMAEYVGAQLEPGHLLIGGGLDAGAPLGRHAAPLPMRHGHWRDAQGTGQRRLASEEFDCSGEGIHGLIKHAV